MTPKGAMQRIESMEFSVEYNVCSGLGHLLRCIEGDEAFKVLDALEPVGNPTTNEGEPTKKAVLCSRVLELVCEAADPQYEHPRDMAVAAYLWVLRDAPFWRECAADYILSGTCSSWNWFWARRVAQQYRS